MLGDPFRVHANFGDGPEPGLLLSYVAGATGTGQPMENHCLVARGDGSLHELSRDFVTLDFRHEPGSDRWLDLSDLGRPVDEGAPDGP